jgi:hypothetical protein
MAEINLNDQISILDIKINAENDPVKRQSLIKRKRVLLLKQEIQRIRDQINSMN